MFLRLLFIILSVSIFGSMAFGQGESSGPGTTVVRCTQNSAVSGRFRYNIRIFRDSSTQLYANLHKVNMSTNFGQSIFLRPVQSAIASKNPLTVTFWTSDNTFILKVPAKYQRGNAIIDYTGPGLMQADGVNFYMNCFTVVH